MKINREITSVHVRMYVLEKTHHVQKIYGRFTVIKDIFKLI